MKDRFLLCLSTQVISVIVAVMFGLVFSIVVLAKAAEALPDVSDASNEVDKHSAVVPDNAKHASKVTSSYTFEFVVPNVGHNAPWT